MNEIYTFKEFEEFVENNQKCIVVFSAVKCPPCQRLKKAFKNHDRIAGLPVVAVIVDKMPPSDAYKVLTKFNLSSVPTTIVFVNGKPKRRIVGFSTPQKYVENLSKQ